MVESIIRLAIWQKHALKIHIAYKKKCDLMPFRGNRYFVIFVIKSEDQSETLVKFFGESSNSKLHQNEIFFCNIAILKM